MPSIHSWARDWLCGAILLVAGAAAAHAAVQKSDASDPQVQKYARAQANIKTVLEFYQALANFDFEGCRKTMGDYYIQHNPNIEDGIEGLKKALASGRRMLGPTARNKVEHKLIVAEGEYVILLSHSVVTTKEVVGEEPPRGQAVADIFRLENGKIVEHWDTVQSMPEKLRNSGMF